jgi:hypothetical protein
MTQFCEECPLRGRCSGDLVALDKTLATKSRFSGGVILATVGAFRDIAGHLSELIRVPHDVSEHALMAAIDDCEYPIIEEEGLLRRRQETHCRAIGEYALDDRRLAESAELHFSQRNPT